MNVNIETTSALRRKLTIELEAVEITRELDRAYNELRRSVQLKGFRPGHAPRNLLERFFGDQVRGDVIQKLVKEYTDKALEEHDLKPVVEPEIVTEETDLKNAQLRFSAVFDLKPELVVKDYVGLKAPKGAIEVKEEEVDAALERLRERSATLKKVEERDTVEEGDFVIAHLEGFENGKGIPGTKLEERIVRVAKDSLAHGLDDVIRGAKTGVEVRHERSYPEDYGEKDIAGKNVEWRATVRDIYTRVLPELDDEFARDQGEFDSLANLRTAVRGDLERRAREEEDGKARQALLDLIIERNPLELPESLVAREERALESETASALEAAGMPHEEAHQRARQNPEENKTRAEKRARATLIVDAIAAQENIDVSDDEVGARVGEMVTRSGRQRERVAEFYGKEENRAALKNAMRREATLATLLERAQSEAETVPAAEQSGETPSSETPPNG
jgi:trigger factor